MGPQATVFVAGGQTLVGAALRRRLADRGLTVVGEGGAEPDLRNSDAVDRFFDHARPAYVFVAAGKSAGIGGNQRMPADLMRDNLDVAAHLVPAASTFGVRKLVYLASSCIYPKHASQPMHPDSLWTGPLEPTSAAYAVAKLAGITLCQAYRRQYDAPFVSVIGADAYGPDDDFSPEDSHVVAGLMRRMHEARVSAAPAVTIWGSGSPKREFIYADDLADACIFAMDRYDGDQPLNLGTGVQTSIRDLAALVREVVGYEGELQFDTSRPDGIPLKGLDSAALTALGWRPGVPLRTGLALTYQHFLDAATQTRG